MGSIFLAPPGTGRGGASLSMAFLRRRGAVLGLSLGAVVAIAALDLATGYELALSMLYAVPVVAATWAFGLRPGLALSALATLAWLATDALAEHRYSLPIYRYWEGFIRLATFSAFAVIIERLRHALARSDARLIKVLEGLDAAVCVTDPTTGAILYRNRRFDLEFAAPGAARVVQRLIESVLIEGDGDESDELQVVDRWYLVRGRRLVWTDGRDVLLVSATDVSRRRAAEALARDQQAKLQATARLVAVGEIASSIAHELNQPLAALGTYVRGALRRLRAGPVDRDSLSTALRSASHQAERAALIIRRVRDYVGSRQSVLASIDLNAVVARAAAAARLEAAPPVRHVDVRLAPLLPPVNADAVMIEQVVLNLVRNAAEASPQGAGTPLVEVCTALTGDCVRVTVADRGRGMPDEQRARIFEPFFTTKPDGMGLGLNICRSIVEFHGGRIWAEARHGGGTELHFTVPRAATP